MQYSAVVIHLGFTEFLPNLDAAELKELTEKYNEVELVVFPAESALDLKDVLGERCDANKDQMPEILADFPQINETAND